MSDINSDTVRHIASLSRLQLTEDEVEQYQRELTAIIAFVEQLNTINTKGVEPTAQVTGLENVMRADTEIDYETTPVELRKNAPEIDNTHIKVRKVL